MENTNKCDFMKKLRHKRDLPIFDTSLLPATNHIKESTVYRMGHLFHSICRIRKIRS